MTEPGPRERYPRDYRGTVPPTPMKGYRMEFGKVIEDRDPPADRVKDNPPGDPIWWLLILTVAAIVALALWQL